MTKFSTKKLILIFFCVFFLNIAFSYTANQVNSCILVNECKTKYESCQKDAACKAKYDEWESCLVNVTEQNSTSNTISVCDFQNNTDMNQELKIDCQTTTCSKYTQLTDASEIFQNFMKCANFCFGVIDDDSIPTTFASITTDQYQDLYIYEAEEVDQCIRTESTSECSSLISACQQDSTCKANYQSLNTCLNKNNYCSHQYSDSTNNVKQRVTCPSTCSESINSENVAFNKLLQCFSYCYGYENAIYFPNNTSLDQYTNLKKESESFLPSIVDACIDSECTSYVSTCSSDNTCKNSYTLFSDCLNGTSYCKIIEDNSSSKLWDICPTVCSNNITSSQLSDGLLNCYQYCYGTEFDETAFKPSDTKLVQYEELYGETPNDDNNAYTYDISSSTYLFTSDLSRAKSERQAIGSAVFIIYLVYIIFYILNLNRKLNEKEFYYLESFLFIFGLSALMSVNYIQSGIFHAIFCYLTFICLLLIFASTVQANSICEELHRARKYLWIATTVFIFVWNLGNIANYYHVGSDHVE